MGPVRIGNQASRQVQHDVYGSAILAATHVFFDRRLLRPGDEILFRRLEPLGECAAQLFDQPDAGLWELRGAARVHTFSSLDRKSTRLNSSHLVISYAVFCLKKKKCYRRFSASGTPSTEFRKPPERARDRNGRTAPCLNSPD